MASHPNLSLEVRPGHEPPDLLGHESGELRIAYAGRGYRSDQITGGNAHIGQLLKNLSALGHEVWTWSGDHPNTKILPTGRLSRIRALRSMDVLYVRVEDTPDPKCRFAVEPIRSLIGRPLVVWEFNTVPTYAKLSGTTDEGVAKTVSRFRRLGKGCDLAVCVSERISEYIRKQLGIRRTLVVPNGSDPTLFHPHVPTTTELGPRTKTVRVVWIGSAGVGWHDFEMLVAAANQLNRDSPGVFEFHVIGSGFELQNLPPNVHYQGPKPYQELPSWLSAMDIGLCLYEPGPADYSSPLKVFDYFASGLTVVATEQPQIRNIFGQINQLDLLVPCGSSSELARVLTDLAANRVRLQEQAEMGRNLLQDRYGWRHAVECIVSEIQKLRI